MRAKLVLEKFSEDGDPIEDMGIGLYNVIKKYINDHDDGDVKSGLITPIMFLTSCSLDNETKKAWIEFLLRKGDDNLNKWEEEFVYTMAKEIEVKFIPNSKVMSNEDLSYIFENGNYYLIINEWTDICYCINAKGDVDDEFIENILRSDGSADRYFDNNYDVDLGYVLDSLDENDKQKLFTYLNPICKKIIPNINSVDIDELFELIEKNGKLNNIKRAIIRAYANILSSAEEEGAYKDILRTIKKDLNITNEEYKNHKLFLTISERGLNKLFISHYIKDEGIEYYAPHYGWSGDFNFDYFIEELENQLDY
jgi:hypothetical protein